MGRKQLRDFELPTLLYLFSEIEKKHFSTSLERASDDQIQQFLDKADIAGSNTMSLTTFKKLLKLRDHDTLYRPKYNTLDLLLSCHYEKEMKFDLFHYDHQVEISEFIEKMVYSFDTKNPKFDSQLVTSRFDLEFGKIKQQINFDESIIKELQKQLEPDIGGFSLNPRERLENMNLEDRARHRSSLNDIRKQKNIENIIQKSLLYMNDNPIDPDGIDHDWIQHFFYTSENCSNERLQYVWAKLLAEHVTLGNRPLKFTLHRLHLLEQRHALVFSFMCNNSFVMGNYNGIFDRVFYIEEDYYTKSYYSDLCDIQKEDLEFLEDIGLIEFEYLEMKKDFEYTLDFFGKKTMLISEKDQQELCFVYFTYMGDDLFNVANFGPDQEGYDLTIQFIKSLGITVR